MRRRNDHLADECAEAIRPLLPQARRAYGQQKQGTPTRNASDRVNVLLLEYDEQNGNITELAEKLEGDITLAGLRRRLRVARSGMPLGVKSDRSFRGIRDPEKVSAAVKRIKARAGTPEYGLEIRSAYHDGLALSAIAEELGVTYFTAWSSMSTAHPVEAEAVAG